MKPVAVLFDLFGTLLEIGAIGAAAAAVTDEPDRFVLAWREKQIGYTWCAAAMERYEDFDEITAHALDYTAARFGIPLAPEQRAALLGAWHAVRAYDDAVPTLLALREARVRAGVLTNGTPPGARAAIANAGATDLLDAVLSVDAARTFKPRRSVYALATTHYGCDPGDLMFVTSNGWDATGARAFGFQTIWCNRAGLPAETFGPPPDVTIRTLTELVPLVAKAPV